MITITNEDNMDLMARYSDKHFDLAIVDPPYGIGDINHTDSRNFHKKIKWNNSIPSAEYFKEVFRVSKNQIIWGINYYANMVPHTGRIIHDKSPSNKQYSNLSDGDIASHSFGVNVKIFRYEWRGNVQGSGINWKNEGTDARIHPTQKPVALYKWLLDRYAKPGDKILDTHLGSGSIAIACNDLGFDLTACELDTDYYNAALKRLEEHQSQLTLFTPTKPLLNGKINL